MFSSSSPSPIVLRTFSSLQFYLLLLCHSFPNDPTIERSSTRYAWNTLPVPGIPLPRIAGPPIQRHLLLSIPRRSIFRWPRILSHLLWRGRRSLARSPPRDIHLRSRPL